MVRPSAQDIRINVTGTNIKRVDTETAAPIETITREDIQASGLQTISDVVRQITANNNGTISPSFTNGFSASGSAVSLRGLGPNNTLVLLNGRRLANFGLAEDAHASYVDLQQIPFDAVERIEVLKDGASAIYGSDAVAGVVNVILRQQYTGFTATGDRRHHEQRRGQPVQGRAHRSASATSPATATTLFVTLDGQRQEAIPIEPRAGITSAATTCGSWDCPTRARAAASGFANVSCSATCAPVRRATRTARPAPTVRCRAPARRRTRTARSAAGSARTITDLQPAIDRFNVFTRGTYRFSDAIEGYTELSYFEVKTDARNPPPRDAGDLVRPVDATSCRLAPNIYLPVGHPDNPFSANQVARLFYVDGALGGSDATYETARSAISPA